MILRRTVLQNIFYMIYLFFAMFLSKIVEFFYCLFCATKKTKVKKQLKTLVFFMSIILVLIESIDWKYWLKVLVECKNKWNKCMITSLIWGDASSILYFYSFIFTSSKYVNYIYHVSIYIPKEREILQNIFYIMFILFSIVFCRK